MAEDTTDAATSVLVVEDDFDLRDALVPILEYEGHRVVSAANGREALDQLSTMTPPSLILLDLMMPVMDGEGFRAEQLRDPRLAGIPIVVVSAHPKAEERAARMGAVGCLRKPLDVDELVDVVRRTSTRLAASLPTNPATSPTRRTAR
jgi:CheY-like chemotaxis protein